jgi:membrane protease YdiL (CAAX protease family)
MRRPASRAARFAGPLARGKEVTAALAFAAFLLAYGNGLSALPDSLRGPLEWVFFLANLTLLPLVLVWAVAIQGLSFASLGLTRRNALASAGAGAALAALVSIPVVLYFIFPVGVAEGSIDYEEVEDLSMGSFLLWAFFRQPVGTAIFEEVVFRGVLQGSMTRAFGTAKGILATAATFALWHVVINYRTIQDTNIGDSAILSPLAQVGSIGGLVLGGLFLSLLRHRTRNLAGPIVFHWLIVVAMNGTLFALAQ